MVGESKFLDCALEAAERNASGRTANGDPRYTDREGYKYVAAALGCL